MGLEALSGARVLVTGAGGYLGTQLVRSLRDIPCRLRLLARAEVPAPPRRNGIPEMLRGDIRDPQIWETALEGVDVVFHFAAQTSDAVADADPQADRAVNVDPVLSLLTTCEARGWRPVVLFPGTAAQYGCPTRVPVDETFPDEPRTVYALHKSIAELYVRYYARRGVVRGATLRLPNLYGTGPAPSSAGRGVLNAMVRRALEGGTLTIHGDGRFLRDYLHVGDAAAAFIAAAVDSERITGRHFVVGTGRGHTVAVAIRMVAEVVEQVTGRRVFVEHVRVPAAETGLDSRNYVANPAAFTEATGWAARYTLREGLTAMVKDLVSSRAGAPAGANE
jgi:nucleoside-diphosphate-sugar epimerase